MQSKLWKQIVAFGLAFGLSLTCAQPAWASDSDQSDNNSVQGTWLAKVTNPNGTSFLSLQTYFTNGEYVEDANGLTFRTASQGEWVKTGPRQFLRNQVLFTFTPTSRVFTGITKVVAVIHLDKDGGVFTAESTFQVYDPQGNLTSSGQNTQVARRCGLDDSIPNCLGIGP